jgi:hypothetical protein
VKKFNWQVKCRREIEKHARHVGAADTDDLSKWLVAWAWNNPRSKDRVGGVIECARRLGRKDFTEAEANAVIQEADATPRAKKADDLARYLRVDYATRQALGFTQIGAFDADKRERKRRRQERSRLFKERRRRDKGAKLRAEYEANSKSQKKPWDLEGTSRRTWYRQQKRQKSDDTSGTAVEQRANCGEKASGTSPDTAVLLYAVATPVPPRKEGLERGRVPLGETCANERRVSPRLRWSSSLRYGNSWL